MTDATLHVRNWDKWQSYRKDRGQPPWIKIHREVMRNPDWVSLTDAQRGQLVAIWLLAADHNGVIPASPTIIRKLCYLDNEPDINLFIQKGFLETPDGCQRDASVTPERRQGDVPETETETETDAAAADAASRLPEAELFDRGKEVLGKNSGGMIKKLLAAKQNSVPLARAAIEQASTKSNPREYIGAVIRNRDSPDQDYFSW